MVASTAIAESLDEGWKVGRVDVSRLSPSWLAVVGGGGRAISLSAWKSHVYAASVASRMGPWPSSTCMSVSHTTERLDGSQVWLVSRARSRSRGYPCVDRPGISALKSGSIMAGAPWSGSYHDVWQISLSSSAALHRASTMQWRVSRMPWPIMLTSTASIIDPKFARRPFCVQLLSIFSSWRPRAARSWRRYIQHVRRLGTSPSVALARQTLLESLTDWESPQTREGW